MSAISANTYAAGTAAQTQDAQAAVYAKANAECGMHWGYVKAMTEIEFLDHMKSKIRAYLMGQGFASGPMGNYGYITVDHVVDVIVSNLRLYALMGVEYPDYNPAFEVEPGQQPGGGFTAEYGGASSGTGTQASFGPSGLELLD